MKELRRIQGDQWYITLPAEWRQALGLEKATDVEMNYQLNSVLVVNPEGRRLSKLEEMIIELLINVPSWKDTNTIAEKLQEVLDKLEA